MKNEAVQGCEYTYSEYLKSKQIIKAVDKAIMDIRYERSKRKTVNYISCKSQADITTMLETRLSLKQYDLRLFIDKYSDQDIFAFAKDTLNSQLKDIEDALWKSRKIQYSKSKIIQK